MTRILLCTQLTKPIRLSSALAVCFLTAFIGFAFFIRPAAADTCTFTQAISNDFSNAGNWDASCHGGIAAPGNGDYVIIPTGKNATTTADVTVSTSTIIGVLSLNGKNFSTTSTYQSVQVQAGGLLNVGSGYLGASGTIVIAATGQISMNNSTGLIRLMGDWNNSGTLSVGGSTSTIDFNGSGTQNVTNAEPNFPNLIKTGAGTLSLGGAVTILGSATSSAGTFTAGANNLTILGTTFVLSGATVTSTSGVITFSEAVSSTGSIGSMTGGSFFASTFQNNGAFALGSGSSTAIGQITNSASGIIKNEQGVLHINANWTNAGLLNGGTGTVELNGSAAQTIAAEPNFYLLKIFKPSQTATLIGNVTTTNNLTITSGTLALGSYTLSVGGHWSDSGTLSGGTGTVKFNGTGDQSILTAEPNFFNLEKTGAGALTLSGNVTALGDASSLAGVITAGANALTITGTMLVSSGAVVTSTTGVLTFVGAASSTGLIGTNSGGSVFASTFQNNGTLELGSGSSTIVGQMTNVGMILNQSGTLHIYANWTNNNGALNGGTGTVEMNGSAAQTISNEGSFNNLTINKPTQTATLTGNVTSTNNLTITSGTLALGANTLFVGGSWSDSGTLSGGTGTVNMYAGDSRTVSAEAHFNNLTKTGAGTLTLGGAVIVLGNATTSAGTLSASASALTITGTTNVLSGATVTSTSGVLTFTGAASSTGSIGTNSGGSVFASTFQNNGTLELGSGSSTFVGQSTNVGNIKLETGTLHVNANWTNGGTLTAGTGTIELNGSAAQSIVAEPNFYNLTVSKTDGAVATLAGNSTVSNAYTLTTGILSVNTRTFTVGGAYTNTGGQVTISSGNIVHASTNAFTESDGTSTSTVQATFTANGGLYVTLTDGDRNLSATNTETITVTVAATSASGSDSESLTLTETSASSGIFRNTAVLPLAYVINAVLNDGTLSIHASDTGTATYTDTYDATDVTTDTVTLTLAVPTPSTTTNTGGPGGGGGGGSVTLFNYTNLPSPVSTTANVSTALPLTFMSNSLVKLANDGNAATQQDSAVYYYGKDGRRHAFPNDKAYFTWYSDFSQVQVISAADMARMPLGQNVTYRPGVRMVKFATLNNVYAVDAGGLLHWVKTEAVATTLYGSTWNKQIDDINDAFYPNYHFGSDISTAADFTPSAVMTTASSIQKDMGF